MVKKRNRRTRKKYKKRGGASDAVMKACNIRLKEQGVGIAKRGNMCIESDGKAGLKKVEEPVREPIVQPVAQQVSQEPKQPSGVETVIAPLEEPSIKDRASALAPQLVNRTKGRKALRTTVGSCRAAVDKGIKYYYNEAGEQTESPPGTPEFDKVCNPTDGIEKTGNKSGNCIGARYKGGEEYWYHPKKQFSTHDKNHPLCHEKDEVKAEDIKLPEEPNLSLVRLIETSKTKKKRKKKRRTAKSYQRAASERNRRKQMKENKRKSKKGGRRTKRKKSRKSRR